MDKLKQYCECRDSMGCTIKALQEIIVNKCEIVKFHYFVPSIVVFWQNFAKIELFWSICILKGAEIKLAKLKWIWRVMQQFWMLASYFWFSGQFYVAWVHCIHQKPNLISSKKLIHISSKVFGTFLYSLTIINFFTNTNSPCFIDTIFRKYFVLLLFIGPSSVWCWVTWKFN